MTRRKLFNWAAGSVLAHVVLAQGRQSPEKGLIPLDTLPDTEKRRKLKVVFVGAHVDDWTICSGTLGRYARGGHAVLCLSFTPGDSQSMAEANHMSVDKLAALRREDAMRGIQVIGARFKVLNQQNQNMRVDPATYDQFNKTLSIENPDVVFGMWPLEFHPDHRAAGILAYNAWLASGMKFTFYFSETPSAGEMNLQQFVPNRWVDVESVMDLKRESLLANTLIQDEWAENELWAKFRGAEYGCKYAEAFVHIATVASIAPHNQAPRRWSAGGVQVNHD
jgi:LmbE family N-acetylglucosaminyl deacetylase